MGECCNNKEDISLSCHCGANDSFKSNSSQPKCQNCSVKKKVRSEKEFKAFLYTRLTCGTSHSGYVILLHLFLSSCQIYYYVFKMYLYIMNSRMPRYSCCEMRVMRGGNHLTSDIPKNDTFF